MTEQTEQVELGLIQGQKPRSKNEWFVSLALDEVGHEYIYQYKVRGGHIRGGYFLDFLVVTAVPRSTGIEVFGDYWHSGEITSEDTFRIRRIEHDMRIKIKVIWGKDSDNFDVALQAVIKAVGRRR